MAYWLCGRHPTQKQTLSWLLLPRCLAVSSAQVSQALWSRENREGEGERCDMVMFAAVTGMMAPCNIRCC